jgi:hypothetical protein
MTKYFLLTVDNGRALFIKFRDFSFSWNNLTTVIHNFLQKLLENFTTSVSPMNSQLRFKK